MSHRAPTGQTARRLTRRTRNGSAGGAVRAPATPNGSAGVPVREPVIETASAAHHPGLYSTCGTSARAHSMPRIDSCLRVAVGAVSDDAGVAPFGEGPA
jgi:hypothetical protein